MLLVEFLRVDFILLSTRSSLAANFQKITEHIINKSFLTIKGSVVKKELES